MFCGRWCKQWEKWTSKVKSRKTLVCFYNYKQNIQVSLMARLWEKVVIVRCSMVCSSPDSIDWSHSFWNLHGLITGVYRQKTGVYRQKTGVYYTLTYFLFFTDRPICLSMTTAQFKVVFLLSTLLALLSNSSIAVLLGVSDFSKNSVAMRSVSI